MEPELGLGTVLHLEGSRVQIFFPASGEMRLYALKNAPLIRVRFKVGDTILDHENQKFIVGQIEENNGLIVYKGDGWSVPEALLSDTISFHTAEDRLLNSQFDDQALFRLRQHTLRMQHYQRKSDVRGFLGGRIDLIPHQLYIAHEVSSRQAPRVLLSDEVGLGKTIEACLIIHRMVLSGRATRMLIVVPESLVHQWFVELYRRFNLWFHIYDEERSVALEGDEGTENPFFDDQLVLCSLQFLAQSPKRAQQVLEAEWDMLVVDEAHHLEWTPSNASEAYTLVEQLSKQASGLLLLTATPVQLGLEGHFARLRLLDPGRYTDFDVFLSEGDSYKEVAELADALESDRALTEDEEEWLKSRFGEADLTITELLASIQEGDEVARKRVAQDVIDIHGPGRVIFRNTRATIEGFPGRKVHLNRLEAESEDKEKLKRAAEEFELDKDVQAAFPRRLLKDDLRIEWLVEWVKQHEGEKALLICRSKDKALHLHKALLKLINIKAGLFHEDLSLVQRDRNAAWFAEEDGARLLLCSEIGSEGRNFQFAHHLILFDLPHDPELLEQRIGRLDRIGQKETIQIHVPFLAGGPQEVLARWYHEGLNAFEESLVGGRDIVQRFGGDMFSLATASLEPGGFAEKELQKLLKSVTVYHDELKKILAEGRNRLLEKSSFQPEVARELIEHIVQEDQQNQLETYLHEVFEQFGMQSDEIANRTYRIKPGPTARDAFPSVPEGGTSVTFDRSRALVREDIGFMTWDHPMVSGAIDLVLGSERGNSSFAVYPEGPRDGFWLEVSYVLESIADSKLHVDRFLPPTPIRLLIDNQLRDLSELFEAESLEPKLVLGRSEDWMEDAKSMQNLQSLMIDKASFMAEEKMSHVIEESLEKMKNLYDIELGRLEKLKNLNQNIREEEIDAMRGQKKALIHAILQARLRIDSMRLIAVKKG